MNLGGFRFKVFQSIAVLAKWIPVRRTNYFDLVIVRADSLGDFVIWNDALQAYKKKYNGRRVLLICSSIDTPLAQNDRFFDEILSFNGRKIATKFDYFLVQFIKTRSIVAKTVIYPVWERHVIGDFYVHTIKAEEKIAMVGVGRHDFWWHYYNKKYTTLVNNPPTQNEITAIEYFTQMIVSKDYKYGYNMLTVTWREMMLDCGRYAVIAISSSVAKKIWELNKFAAIIDMIPSDYKVVLLGAGEDDVLRAKQITDSVDNNTRIINLINKTSILDMISVISKAAFVIGNDSAAVHIAAATHVPSICVFHGAHFGRFLPYPDHLPYKEFNPHIVFFRMNCYGCGFDCKQPEGINFECLHRVSIDMVNNALNEILRTVSL